MKRLGQILIGTFAGIGLLVGFVELNKRFEWDISIFLPASGLAMGVAFIYLIISWDKNSKRNK